MARHRSRKKQPKVLHRSQSNLGAHFWAAVASVLIFTVGMYRAIELRWICDDAFITLRYVKNFVEGKGLVYNIGERVEGYTNFLWLMLLVAARAVGLEPVNASIWLGIASFAGILLLLLKTSYLERPKRAAVIWLPIAGALFALNYDATVWASGGLETSLYALLILSSFYVWFHAKFPERPRLFMVGSLLALVTLTRPDGLLFTATAVGLLVVRGVRMKSSIGPLSKTVGTILLPSVIVGVPYLVWKYCYYGNLLPLTYYAKSAGEDYFIQGIFYIWLYFRIHFVSGIALLSAVFLLFLRRVPAQTVDGRRGSPAWTALASIVIYLLVFVARVGGDFMFARFMLPVVPLMCLLIEYGVEAFTVKRLRQRIGIVLLLLLATIFSDTIYPNPYFRINSLGEREENWNLVVVGNGTRHIGEERWYYYNHFEHPEVPYGTMYINTIIGQFYDRIFAGLPVTVGVPGSMNMIAYYANFHTAINEYGLTDSFIAHMPEFRRGRIGHEKYAPMEYLQRRNVNFQLGSVVSKLPAQLAIDELAFQIPSLGLWQLGKVVVYDRSIMDSLAARFVAAGAQVRMPLYEMIIPHYIETALPLTPQHELEVDYAKFKALYFDRYPDSTLQRPFEERIPELKAGSAADTQRGQK